MTIRHVRLRCLLLALAIGTLLAGCDAVSGSVLELRNTYRFALTEAADASGVTLHISGFSGDSARVVSGITETTRGDTLVFKVHEVLAHDDGRTGSFEHDIRVPTGVSHVVYGDEEQQIWPAPP
jgi:hypothetical protein